MTFPFSNHFTCEKFNDLNKGKMRIKPRVIVANSPFVVEDGNTQDAGIFIEKSLH
jgi:hypothetical protein